MEDKIIQTRIKSVVPWLKRKKKVAEKPNGPKFTLIVENFGGIKRQTITGCPTNMTINHNSEMVHTLGNHMPFYIPDKYFDVTLRGSFQEAKFDHGR